MRRLSVLFRASLLLFVLCSASAHAQIINAQFSWNLPNDIYTGAAIIGSAGNYWNNIGTGFGSFGFSNVALNNTANNNTSVTISNSDVGGFNRGTAHNDQSQSQFPGDLKKLVSSYLFSAATQAQANVFTISGLSSGTYNLYFLTQSNTSNRQLGVTIGATTQISTASNLNASSFILNQNYLVFSNITPVSGTITANWWQVAGEANINGIQIEKVQAVPEPGSMILTGLALAGAGGGAFWRRRKSQSSESAPAQEA